MCVSFLSVISTHIVSLEILDCLGFFVVVLKSSKNTYSEFIHKELSIPETDAEEKVIQVQHIAFNKITFTLDVFGYLSSDIDQTFSLTVNTSLKLKPPICVVSHVAQATNNTENHSNP